MRALVGLIVLALAVSTAPMGEVWAAAKRVPSAKLALTITDVRSSKGHVIARLCSDASVQLLACSTEAKNVAATPGTMKVVFEDLTPGRYGIVLIHDENDSGAYDYPSEGYGYGNDAAYPPTFEAASVQVEGETIAQVRMIYLAPEASSAALIPPPRLSSAITQTLVSENGLNAEFFLGRNDGKVPGLLVMGGSEGGLDIARYVYAPLAEHGYAVLVLAYFRAEGRPERLVQIPLEYFKTALDWLRRQPDVDKKRLGVLGASKGAEAALLIATHFRDVKAVVACAPTDVVWQGIDFRYGAKPLSSWTYKGGDLAFLPYDLSKPYVPNEPLIELHLRSRPLLPQHRDAVIEIEKAGAAILLLSGTDDKVWPSSPMAENVIARLDAHRYRPDHRHVSYAGAGHTSCVGDPTQVWQESGTSQTGGIPDVNRAARGDSWNKTLQFLDEHLK